MDAVLHHAPVEQDQQYLIFRTDLSDYFKVKFIAPLFDHHPRVARWCVDYSDVDNVLKVEPVNGLTIRDVVGLLRSCGFTCEELTD